MYKCSDFYSTQTVSEFSSAPMQVCWKGLQVAQPKALSTDTPLDIKSPERTLS